MDQGCHTHALTTPLTSSLTMQQRIILGTMHLGRGGGLQWKDKRDIKYDKFFGFMAS